MYTVGEKLIKVIYNSNKKYYLREKRVHTFQHFIFRLWKFNSCQFKYMKSKTEITAIIIFTITIIFFNYLCIKLVGYATGYPKIFRNRKARC